MYSDQNCASLESQEMPRSGRWSSIIWSLAHHFDGWHGMTWLMAADLSTSRQLFQMCVFLFTAKFKGIAFRWHAEGEQLESLNVSSLYIILDTTVTPLEIVNVSNMFDQWLTKKVKTIQNPKDPKSSRCQRVQVVRAFQTMAQWPVPS